MRGGGGGGGRREEGALVDTIQNVDGNATQSFKSSPKT